MYSFVTVINAGNSVFSVNFNDEELISCLLPNEISKPKRVIYPSTWAVVKNGREKLVFDILLPIKKEASHTLILWDTHFLFI